MRRFRLLAVPFVLSLAVAALVACSPANSNGPAASAAGGSTAMAQSVTVSGSDALKFDPSSITVKAGQPVTVTFKNTGQMAHDWSLAEGAAQPVKISAAGGQSASAMFTIDHPGTYTFICSVPGHAAAGMTGTLTAQ